MSVVALLLSCYVLISLKGRKMSEVTARGAGREEAKLENVAASTDSEFFTSYM